MWASDGNIRQELLREINAIGIYEIISQNKEYPHRNDWYYNADPKWEGTITRQWKFGNQTKQVYKQSDAGKWKQYHCDSWIVYQETELWKAKELSLDASGRISYQMWQRQPDGEVHATERNGNVNVDETFLN